MLAGYFNTDSEELGCADWGKHRILCKPNQKSDRKRRRVTFHTSVKKWDGVSCGLRNLQRLILDFWDSSPSPQLLDDLLEKQKYEELCMLHDDLVNVMQRIKQLGSATKSTPLSTKVPLRTKIGARTISVGVCHLPYINRLRAFTERARDKCYRQLSLI